MNYLLVKHKFTSVHTCNKKVAEYIAQGSKCYLIKDGNYYRICFAKSTDKNVIKKLQQSYKTSGFIVSVIERSNL